MVQGKKLMNNYISSQYKSYAEKKITKNSYKKGIFMYLALFAGVTITQLFGGKKDNQLLFLNIQTICVVLFLIQNMFYYYFYVKLIKYKKYCSLGLYISAIVSVFLMLAYVSLLVAPSFKTFAYSIVTLFCVCLTMEIIYLITIRISLKNEDMKLRDATAQNLLNGVSILGIILMILSEVIDNFEFGVLGFTFMGAMILFLATFHFPRILRYWKKEPENTSVYGNSIELIKKKNKK